MAQTAVRQAMTIDAQRATALRALVDRADRARAQAIANCESLERAMSRTRAFVPSLDNVSRPSSQAATEARIRDLQDTVDGLTKRLESQGPIEQAKGIIMAQNRCDADRAFEILRRASQRSNTKLRVLAEELVARTSGVEIAR